MMDLNEILKISIEKKCTNIYISVGTKIYGRINSNLEIVVDEIIDQNIINNYAKEILLNKYEDLDLLGEMYKSISISGIGRFKIYLFKQRNSICISIKILSINTYDEYKRFLIPEKINEYICELNQGLVLISGPIKSGKSTTIANLIQNISRKKSKYIISVESSIEILLNHNNSIVNQREIGSDTKDYLSGINSAFKENVDILMVDNIENYEVLKAILKCCDSGMLVISSIYANSTRDSLEYLLELDRNNSNYIRNSLSNNLRSIINQRIVAGEGGGDICLHEIVINTRNVSECIRENKIKNIQFIMQNGLKLGMCTLDISLIEAYKSNKISKNILLKNISNRELAAKIILNY